MKSTWFVFFLLIGPYCLFGQLKYEDLEKYSKAISEIQYRSQPFYSAGVKFTFPQENFITFYSTKLASFGYYNEDKTGEDFFLREGIDFALTKDLFCDGFSDGSEFITLQLDKPSDLTILKADGSKRSSKISMVYFVYKKGNVTDKKLLFENLVALTFQLKIYARPHDAKIIEEEHSAWKKASEKSSFIEYKNFATKYPSSVLFKEAKNRMETSDPSVKAIKSYFDSYRAGWNRSKKYLELWGNWKPGKDMMEYSGLDKNISSEYRNPSFKPSGAPYKTVYLNSNISFDLYTYNFGVYNNYASANRDAIRLAKRDLFPRGIGVNGNREVVHMQYTVRSKYDLVDELSLYLGYRFDASNQIATNVTSYDWYFDDCTVSYWKYSDDTLDGLYLFYHDRFKVIPNGSFTIQLDGTHKITPEIWKKMMGIQ